MSTTVNQDQCEGTCAPNQVAAAKNVAAPEVNIFETAEGYVLEAEMPGVNKEGVDLTVEGNALTIVGRRGRTEPKAEAIYRESSDADYQRVFELDPAIDTAKIEANVEQGVLTVRLPKSDRVKSRKIAINN